MTAEPPYRTPIDVLAAFVVRARRIAAHSLAQNPDHLRGLATEWTMSVDANGRVVIVRSLPDEERFESLAARLRPLTLKSEPIWYPNVLNAIRQATSQGGEPLAADLAAELDEITDGWNRWDTENFAMRGYTTQLARAASPDDEPSEVFAATDTQLGAGWFYADVAHANPKGKKAVALEFPLAERYAAAVRIYSGLALVVLRTLTFIEKLRNSGHLRLPESAWTTPITVESGEFERESTQVYFAPAGTPLPPIGQAKGPEWEPITMASVERLIGILHLDCRLIDPDGAELGAWPATTRRRIEEARIVGVNLDLDGLVELRLPQPDVETAQFTASFSEDAETNAQFLRILTIRNCLYSAQAMELWDPAGILMLRLSLRMDPGELTVDDRVTLEACTDLVRIEQLTGITFPLIGELPPPNELVRRRVLRLILEGKLTYAMPQALDVETADGTPPEAVRIEQHAEIIDTITVPVPPVLIWHPDLQITPLNVPTPHPAYRVTAPPTERLLTWAPSLQDGDFDPRTATTTPWGLEDLFVSDN